jgi:hypothetical protein
MKHWQLLAAIVWLTLGVTLLFRETIAPGQMTERNWDRVAYVAIALALWNLLRWYSMLTNRRENVLEASPLKPHRRGGDYEYNPDLDFQKMDREAGR